MSKTEYDDSRLLPTKVTDPLNQDITTAYDDDGRQTSMTNRRGKTYTTLYNDTTRTVTTATPENKVTEVTANTRGLPETTIRPSGRIVKNETFDAEGHVLTQTIKAPDGLTTLGTVVMTYDTAGRLKTITEAGKTTERTYDSLGRLFKYADGEGNVIEYGYDNADNLVSLKYPGGKTVTYAYDDCNRLSTVTDWADRVTTYEYDLAGRMTKTTRPNDTVRTHIYDIAGQVRQITERKADNDLLWTRSFEYDKDGRITKTFTWPSQAGEYAAVNKDDTASYDADNRLKTWAPATGSSIECVFDNDGNLLTGPNAQGTAETAYTYDHHNRLTGVGSQANYYRYSPDGHRVQAGTVQYVIDPVGSLSRTLIRKDGASTTYCVWGVGLVYEVDESSTKTYHPDHLGSTMVITDDSGTQTAAFEYDSYGSVTYSSGNPSTPFKWHGTLGVTTEANGLISMRARFYHPHAMRFLNQDPIGFEGGMNLFAFVNGNPMLGIDPKGLHMEAFVQDFFMKPGLVEQAGLTQQELLHGPTLKTPSLLEQGFNAYTSVGSWAWDGTISKGPLSNIQNAHDVITKPHSVTLGIGISSVIGNKVIVDKSTGVYLSWDLSDVWNPRWDYGTYTTTAERGVGFDPCSVGIQLSYYNVFSPSGTTVNFQIGRGAHEVGAAIDPTSRPGSGRPFIPAGTYSLGGSYTPATAKITIQSTVTTSYRSNGARSSGS